LQPISAFRVSCLGQREQHIAYEKPVSYGIRRREFDEYLVRRCRAEVRENVPIKSVERSAGNWIINGEFKAPVLIGAGGHFCPVARLVGGKESETPVVAQEVEFLMDDAEAAQCRVSGETPELFFCRDLQGYGWCFRKGNYLNIGLGRLDQHKLGQHVKDFAKFLHACGRIGFDVSRRFAGHAYLLYGFSQRKILNDGLMLIGDSAGLAYAQSGEGIRPAVESGLMAATVVRAADGQYSAERLNRYAELLRDRFATNSSIERLATRVPRGLRSVLGRALLRSDRFCRTMVVENWFLRMNDGPLPPFASFTEDRPARVAV
jgi:flavin-dependent dehydrogenase